MVHIQKKDATLSNQKFPPTPSKHEELLISKCTTHLIVNTLLVYTQTPRSHLEITDVTGIADFNLSLAHLFSIIHLNFNPKWH